MISLVALSRLGQDCKTLPNMRFSVFNEMIASNTKPTADETAGISLFSKRVSFRSGEINSSRQTA